MGNREILFRAKKLGTDGWLYGLLHRSYASCDNIDMIQDIETGELEYINTTTIGQFTGLLDKNGTKIFEGDRCKTIKKDIVIKYENGGFKREEVGYDYKYSLPQLSQNDIDRYEFEVIGTIHDHIGA